MGGGGGGVRVRDVFAIYEYDILPRLIMIIIKIIILYFIQIRHTDDFSQTCARLVIGVNCCSIIIHEIYKFITQLGFISCFQCFNVNLIFFPIFHLLSASSTSHAIIGGRPSSSDLFLLLQLGHCLIIMSRIVL